MTFKAYYYSFSAFFFHSNKSSLNFSIITWENQTYLIYTFKTLKNVLTDQPTWTPTLTFPYKKTFDTKFALILQYSLFSSLHFQSKYVTKNICWKKLSTNLRFFLPRKNGSSTFIYMIADYPPQCLFDIHCKYNNVQNLHSYS